MTPKIKAKDYEMFIKLYLSEEKSQRINKEFEYLRPLIHRWRVSEKYVGDCICYQQAFLNCKLYKELELFNQIIKMGRK